MAVIIIEKGNSQDVGKRFPLTENIAIVGRAAADNNPDIAVHDDFVSRSHAEISHHQNYFMLRDLDSKNGTEIDGQRIKPGQFYPLRNDANIGLGISTTGTRVLLRFKESQTTATIRIYSMDETVGIDWMLIDQDKKEVRVDGKIVNLSRKEFGLLLFLLKRTGKTCSRDEIIAEVWPESKDPGAVSDATIDQLIHRLREKIEPDVSQPKRLINKKGFGYILN
jgi:two-component system response regulator QseB